MVADCAESAGYPVDAEEGVAMGVDWGGLALVDTVLTNPVVFIAKEECKRSEEADSP